ncbi:MAG: hypothetical protein ACK52I_07700 [Pseudomonadota bacterium]
MSQIYTLHKLPEGFIVNSDEEIKSEDLFLDIKLKSIFKCHSTFNNIQSGLNGRQYHPKYECFKVIAQQDQIDLSSLSEEDQKKIGWFDVDKLGYEFCDKTIPKDVTRSLHYPFKVGFQKAQELLSDKRFTLEDMVDFAKYQQDYKENASIEDNFQTWKLKSLSQPKSWKVELEMTEVHSDHIPGGFELCPLYINGKVKILKLL